MTGKAVVERAVERVLATGFRTDDLAESGCQRVGTREMGQRVADAVMTLAASRVPA